MAENSIEAVALVAKAIDEGHAAHGYLVVGDIDGSCMEFTSMVLEKLFPGEAERIASRSHPDIAWLEPSGAAQEIKVERTKGDPAPGIRDRIVGPMSVTSFCGGWKVGVIVSADRMNEQAANAFLKSLEEPTPKTMYLLLTDQPDAILPTIVSRTQRIDLPQVDDVLEEEELLQVRAAFLKKDAAGLSARLEDAKKNLEPADFQRYRKRLFRTLIGFARKLMLDGRLPRHLAFRNIEALEDAFAGCVKYLPAEMMLSYAFDRVTFPK